MSILNTIATIAVGSLPTSPEVEQRAEQDEHCAEQEQTQQVLDAHEALRGANNRGVPGAGPAHMTQDTCGKQVLPTSSARC